MHDLQAPSHVAVGFLMRAFVFAISEAQYRCGDYTVARASFEKYLTEKHRLSQNAIDIYWRTMLAAYRLGAEDQKNGDYKP